MCDCEMDKRFKRPMNQQRGGYVDQQNYGQHAPRSAYQQPYNNYTHPNHGYNNYNNNSNNYYKPPPPPQQPTNVRGGGGCGGGWLDPAPLPQDCGNANNGSDVVTLIVENNNLKRMIVLHLNVMQDQTESILDKEKELEDKNGRIKTLLAQNQEQMQQIAKLSLTIEDLRKEFRRHMKRSANDTDGQPKLKSQCCADKQTQTPDFVPKETVLHGYKHGTHLKQTQNVLVTSVTDLPPTTPAFENSKVRGEFNGGKKVRTFFLHRVHQEEEQEQQQEEEEVQQQEEEVQQQEEERQKQQQEQLQLQLDEEELHTHMDIGEEEELEAEVDEEEEHIYHDALDTHEMEIVTETIIGAEEELGAEETAEDNDNINNGHIYEEEVEMEHEIVNNCDADNLWQHEADAEEEQRLVSFCYSHKRIYS